VLVVIALWAVGISDAQEGLTKRDRQGPVTVTVTLTESPSSGVPVRAKIVLDTHSIALDGIALEQVVALRVPDGSEVGPTAVEQAQGRGHHREAVLIFPPLASPGALRIVVRNVGSVAERQFIWELPPKP